MTSEEPGPVQHAPWQGRSVAVAQLRELLTPCAPSGMLRLVVQRLSLVEHGRPAGEHEVISSVADVDGNLVAVPLRESVRADRGRADAVDAAIAQLRQDLAADGLIDVSGLEVIIDADGTEQVRIARDLEVAPSDLHDGDPFDTVHDGDHHITRHAPALEDLRDRLAEQSTSPLRRAWESLQDVLRRLR
ncbi:hypothetical protein M3G50_06355 [Brachybacterium muris]|uniref:hypothetical protein n=1 Tax=Brachybacterium muris TaxID=219301 RepID=UPI0021A27889|nr:hypothetical protein [Brachybacterium muris]MCT1430375.1 hypothetical protein [Brachybacterium muris]